MSNILPKAFIASICFGATSIYLGLGFSALWAQEHREERLDKLERILTLWHEEIVASMPNEVREETHQFNATNELSLRSQEWFQETFCFNRLVNHEIGEMILSFEEIRRADDARQLLEETFWARLKGRPLQVMEKIDLTGMYWKENDSPPVNLAPVGQGRIWWIWKLEVKDRPHGVLHVGMDESTRRFLCYEQTIGVYYPEGNVLERIRAEIVQNPANRHIKIDGKAIGEWDEDEDE